MDPHSAAQAVTTAAQAATNAAHAMTTAAQAGNSSAHWSNWLLFWQDVILLLTGGIIAWYTRETQKLRLLSAMQIGVMQDQAAAARDQVRLTRDALDRDFAQQLRDSEPVFVFRGGSFNGSDTWGWQVQNTGADISHIAVQTSLPCSITLSPSNYLANNQTAQLQLIARPGPSLPNPWSLEIKYRTRLSQIGSKTLTVTGNSFTEA